MPEPPRPAVRPDRPHRPALLLAAALVLLSAAYPALPHGHGAGCGHAGHEHRAPAGGDGSDSRPGECALCHAAGLAALAGAAVEAAPLAAPTGENVAPAVPAAPSPGRRLPVRIRPPPLPREA